MAGVDSLERRVAELAKEATEVAVGMGVLTFQRAQVERQELLRRLRATSATEGPLRENLEAFRSQAEGLARSVVSALGGGVELLEHAMPPEGRHAVEVGRREAKRLAASISSRIGIS